VFGLALVWLALLGPPLASLDPPRGRVKVSWGTASLDLLGRRVKWGEGNASLGSPRGRRKVSWVVAPFYLLGMRGKESLVVALVGWSGGELGGCVTTLGD
tara:strand:- start:20181 stop:20480 length:300 start_codon:yes stop_codon:yes gene_type:complete